MMIGDLAFGAIALGFLVAAVAPFVFFIAIMTINGDGSSSMPYIIMGGGLALVALIAWQLDHPFQFLGAIALPAAGFVAFVALSNLKEYLQRGRERGGNR